MQWYQVFVIIVITVSCLAGIRNIYQSKPHDLAGDTIASLILIAWYTFFAWVLGQGGFWG